MTLDFHSSLLVPLGSMMMLVLSMLSVISWCHAGCLPSLFAKQMDEINEKNEKTKKDPKKPNRKRKRSEDQKFSFEVSARMSLSHSPYHTNAIRESSCGSAPPHDGSRAWPTHCVYGVQADEFLGKVDLKAVQGVGVATRWPTTDSVDGRQGTGRWPALVLEWSEDEQDEAADPSRHVLLHAFRVSPCTCSSPHMSIACPDRHGIRAPCGGGGGCGSGRSRFSEEVQVHDPGRWSGGGGNEAPCPPERQAAEQDWRKVRKATVDDRERPAGCLCGWCADELGGWWPCGEFSEAEIAALQDLAVRVHAAKQQQLASDEAEAAAVLSGMLPAGQA